jgi:hypothetical protein
LTGAQPRAGQRSRGCASLEIVDADGVKQIVRLRESADYQFPPTGF